ncbi:MAG: hypothetical protein GXP41_06805 [Chloroflexi bacterium]|nr:hypothetical protein [Chloroflexota bacterium]
MDTTYKTNSAAYWENLPLDETDQDQLYAFALSEGKPCHLDKFVHPIVEAHCQRELERIVALQKEGLPYQPAESYSVGQDLRFAALGHRLGTIKSIRKGHNPRFGPFTVIAVELESPTELREFVSDFPAAHALNLPVAPEDKAPKVDTVIQLYGQYIREQVAEALLSNQEFVSYNGLWLLKDLLLEVHVGHLNIAEAMIDVAGAPIAPEELLAEMDFPEDADPSLQAFSLNYALTQDARFSNTGTDEKPLWHLVRLLQEGENT